MAVVTMPVTAQNYYSRVANEAFFSVSQFKAFKNCEAGALADLNGTYPRKETTALADLNGTYPRKETTALADLNGTYPRKETTALADLNGTYPRKETTALADLNGTYPRKETTALLVGSYVDAFFSGDLDGWCDLHPEIFNKRTGELKADYKHADRMIARLLGSETIMRYMRGEPQRIFTARLFGYPWKAKFDFYDGEKIVDLKTVRDFEPIYDPNYGTRRGWVEYWGYDLQGAIYQRIEQAVTGRKKPLPFYIAAVTKEETPDIDLLQIPQHVLDAAIKAYGVEDLIDRYALIKDGEIEPSRCERCAFCKETKTVTEPRIYEVYES